MGDEQQNITSPARRFLIIHNPAAGRRRPQLLDGTVRALEARGCSVVIEPTAGPGDAIALAAAARDVDVVVAAGGDGTVGEVAHGLFEMPFEERPALATVPLGTINVLAVELGLPTEAQALARVLADGPVGPITVGVASGRRFVLTAGAGVDAAAVGFLSAGLKRMIGPFAYYVALVLGLLREGGTVFEVEVGGEVRRVSSVIVTNASRYGGEKVVSPDARLEDDDLHVLLGTRHGRWNLMRYGVAFMAGRLYTLPDVEIVPAREMRILAPAGKPVQIDGDNVAMTPIAVSVSPEKLMVVMPG